MKEPSEKSYVVAVCLSMIFGVMGIHLIYLGRYLEALIDIALFIATIYFYINGQLGLAFLFLVVDFLHTMVITIMLFIGAFKDGRGKVVCYPGQNLT